MRAHTYPARMVSALAPHAAGEEGGSFPSGSHRRDRMLTLRKNGRHKAFFSAVLRRRHDPSTNAWGTEPLGRVLRYQRQTRQLSLPEVARVTSIPLKYLYLLERASEEQVWDEPLSLIAYVQRYAEFLNLNPDSALARFIAEIEQVGPHEAARGGGPRTQLLKPLPPPRSRSVPRTLLPLVALGLLVGVVAYSKLSGEQRFNGDKRISPPPATSPAPPSG